MVSMKLEEVSSANGNVGSYADVLCTNAQAKNHWNQTGSDTGGSLVNFNSLCFSAGPWSRPGAPTANERGFACAA